ncbi:MAG: YqhA family protein [Gammaproteobacteria bacterium]|nr:YqhA family protein [Gammaproteobacteria bacterium]
MKSVERIIEGLLWDSRLVVMSGVVAAVLGAFALFYITSVDAFYMISHIIGYASPALDSAARLALRSETVTHVVEIVDGYLLATFLLIFGLGLYELFISKIDQAEQAENASRVLLITSLDDLKGRLAKVVLMILVVRYFEYALEMKFQNAADLLMFAGGITLLGLALYLGSLADKNH